MRPSIVVLAITFCYVCCGTAADAQATRDSAQHADTSATTPRARLSLVGVIAPQTLIFAGFGAAAAVLPMPITFGLARGGDIGGGVAYAAAIGTIIGATHYVWGARRRPDLRRQRLAAAGIAVGGVAAAILGKQLTAPGFNHSQMGLITAGGSLTGAAIGAWIGREH